MGNDERLRKQLETDELFGKIQDMMTELYDMSTKDLPAEDVVVAHERIQAMLTPASDRLKELQAEGFIPSER